VKEEVSYWWEEPFSQTEAMEKADDISTELEDFKEALENHVEGFDIVKTEPCDFEAPPLPICHV
jgi:hypothetical protein